ncbi:MAG TPA: hypothetical protein DCQ26_03405 [Marinilabiliales bacterium]|jgi:hypothetical protein|nr:MAG: hypothetical protein A2W95_12510 [Bacteroidetes bacterium GWA2_40_14]OFX58945.1 MAG: hypothetical protein A2W84_11530 [Bacteroidetes bacterium GWC2_40_13]OFX71316.1 MAG: hypothetical protein A2W96_14215 [Bacteroidetes bacterium GWD2_40_43]OFX91489.1 MAG: hypothetical protein A2W97_04640 [Bacteroidetes bacterium GWE2_40_63]OFY19558.1 MAG: hypothetical protein A2W88_02520 [Bacteroidetes bacterium GWF2_40_13]OFZ32176.1 MAG: hypothetical protein A2437_19360 [Bacteroidetes bacterium RIFOXYC
MQNQPIEFYRERDFGEIINTTIEFVKQNFKIFFKGLLYFIVPLGLVVGAMMGIVQHASLSQSFGQPFDFGVVQIIAIVIALLFSFFLFALLPSLIMSIMLEYQQSGKNDMQLNRIWKRAFDSFGDVLSVSLVIGLLIVLSVAVMVLFATITPWILAIFVLPFLYGIVVVYFALPVRVFEKAPIGESISRSFYLVAGNWWWTFLLVFVSSMVLGIIGIVFYTPLYAYMIFVGVAAAKGGTPEISQAIMVGTYAFSFMGQIMTSSLLFVVLSFQYFNLLEKKDKPGLQQRIQLLLPTQEPTPEQ